MHHTELARRHGRPWGFAVAAALAGPGVGGRGHNRFRLGAALVDRGKYVVDARANSYKTHPKLMSFTAWPHLHAETAVMLHYGLDNCDGLDLYVVRLRRDGDIANAYPCLVCQSVMRTTGIRKIHWTVDDGVKSAFNI